MIAIKQTLKGLINNHYISLCILISFLLNFSIECAARMSVIGGMLYVLKHPFYFLYNIILLLLMYTVALFFKKRIFSISIVSVWWIIACVVNSVLIHFRHTPFIAADFFVIKSALDVMHLYISKFQMVLIVIFTIVAVTFLTIMLIREKPKRPDYKKLSLVLSIILIASLLPVDFITDAKDRSPKANLTEEAYHYGFVCCFLNSIFNSGIDKPDEYSEKSIDSIISNFDLKSIHDPKNVKTPNIVVIQLESFVDPYLFKTAEYNKDPIPNFRKLKNEYSSGKLGVSVFGGGTANTEFEVLTGMSTNFFGIGEYPYETVLHEKAVESVCYDLKELDYTAHAIHNHTGTFYDRYLVYKNLGFDTFTPIEHMNDLNFNKLGWAKSDVFTKYILDSLNSTEGSDFVFAATVQGHGKYPVIANADYEIELINGSNHIMNMKGELEFYINELHNEDAWLGEMISKLSEYPEPVMAIIYGDHMPSLDSPNEVLNEDDIYSTEYVIWTNYETEIVNKRLETYSLIPHALSYHNINNGVLTKLHQMGMSSGEIYSDELHKIQYDMLYGEMYSYEKLKISPNQPTDLKMGINEIVIDDIQINSSKAYIFGKNFTPYSIVYVDDQATETDFIDENTLKIRSRECKNFEKITVCQRSTNLIILGQTKPYYNKN